MDWMVLLLGIVAIAWVNWYFFIVGRRATTNSASSVGLSKPTFGGDQMPEITITVQGGYSPRIVLAKAGQPVHLVFDRQESSSCSEEVVFADFGIRKFLPAFEQTRIVVTPPKPGRYAFTCGMSMLRGELIAEA